MFADVPVESSTALYRRRETTRRSSGLAEAQRIPCVSPRPSSPTIRQNLADLATQGWEQTEHPDRSGLRIHEGYWRRASRRFHESFLPPEGSRRRAAHVLDIAHPKQGQSRGPQLTVSGANFGRSKQDCAGSSTPDFVRPPVLTPGWN